MKDINDLLSQFDDLQDLPVSEEMLGAFVEDKLSESESSMVSDIVNQDIFLMNLVSDAQKDVFGVEMPDHFFEDDVIDFNPIDIFNNDIDEFDNSHILQDDCFFVEENTYDEWTDLDDYSISENNESFNDIDE